MTRTITPKTANRPAPIMKSIIIGQDSYGDAITRDVPANRHARRLANRIARRTR